MRGLIQRLFATRSLDPVSSTTISSEKSEINTDATSIQLDYPVNPRCRPLELSSGGRAIIELMNRSHDRQMAYIGQLTSLKPYLSAIPLRNEDPYDAAWVNDMLPGLDAAFLYAMIATRKPRRYIEIGSGTSTKFVRRAIRDFGLQTRIVSIDPQPRADIDKLCDEVIRNRFEDVAGSFFEELSSDDVLFLDGSHRCLQNSDVTTFFLEVVPQLAPGSLYGIHDVFLPQDYPEAWATRFYSEQYLLAAYLLGGAASDVIEFPAWHLWNCKDSWESVLRAFSWDESHEIERHGHSFWMSRALR
jgi:hypothetical protein